MHRPDLLAAALAATFLGDCAPIDSKDARTRTNEDRKIRPTGSRIPVRDGSAAASVQSTGNRNAVGGIAPASATNVPSVGGR